MAEHIERVVIVDSNGRQRTLILESVQEQTLWITGKELDREGGYTGRMHLIDMLAVKSRTAMRMNTQYGVLENA